MKASNGSGDKKAKNVITNPQFGGPFGRSIKPNARVSYAAVALAVVFLFGASGMTSLLTRVRSVAAFAESIGTFSASDCTTSMTSWDLGETACAATTGSTTLRNIVWVTPNGIIAQRKQITGNGNDTYSIPTSGEFAQVGTWTVRLVNVDGDSIAAAAFVVRDATRATADLSVVKSGPSSAPAGGSISYSVSVYNLGPDAAQNVRLTDATPANTTFVGASQTSGPTFNCTTSSGVTTCSGNLAANDKATFSLVYSINSGTPSDAIITNTASVVSDTFEPASQTSDNSATVETEIGTTTTSPCTINCPNNISVNNDPQSANPCVAMVSYTTPTASGSCEDPDTGNPAGPVTCSPPSGTAFPVGTTPVTCSNGAFSCSFAVTVNETRPAVQPTVTCPSDITVSEQPADSGSAVVTYSTTATGNCVDVSCAPPSGSFFAVGTTAVSCVATDSSNQSVTCSFNVTVTSSTGACTLTCPGDITQAATAGQCDAVVNYTAPTTSGDCGTVTCVPASGSSFPSGSTQVTCTSSAGPQCDFAVTVTAAAAPDITTCATDKTVTANSNCEAVIPNLVPEVQASGCNVTVSQSPAAGSVVSPGAVTVTLTAENSAGEDTCTATVTILTPAPPTISCPADITRSNDANQCGAVVTYPSPTGTSPCEGLTISCSPVSGSMFPIGLSNVTCKATDASGTTATCTFKVTVNDTQTPAITCPANITRNSDLDQCSAVVTYASPTATDNCPGVATICNPASGSEFNVGTTTVTCTATDASGLTATCTFTVTVNDNQAPKITCPSNITVGTDPNSSTATVTFLPTVSDNCPGVTFNCSPASGSHFAVGTTSVNCTATDASGNTAACSFSVTVSDNQPPTITCPAAITRSNDPNQCGAVTSYASPIVTDNQPNPTFECSPASGSFFPAGVTQVNCMATDAGGNHSSCSFSVTVVDTQAPVITCPANITAPNVTGQCSATVNPGTPAVSDNCPGVTVVGSRSDGLALNAAYPVGTTTITWTARDVTGNQSSCAQTIVVNDTQAPTISGATANPSTLWPPNHKMVDVLINYTATDNCTPVSQVTSVLSITSNEGTSDDWQVIDAHHVKLRSERLGGGNGRIYTITITSTDSKGNTATSSVTVTVPHNQ